LTGCEERKKSSLVAVSIAWFGILGIPSYTAWYTLGMLRKIASNRPENEGERV
jgi:hypothetical protein